MTGQVPRAYTYIEKCFHERVRREQEDGRIKMLEYYRRNWTFHAKGR